MNNRHYVLYGIPYDFVYENTTFFLWAPIFSYNASDCPRIFNVFSDLKFQLLTEVRTYARNVLTLFKKTEFLGSRSSGRLQKCTWDYDKNFLIVSAPPNWLHRKAENVRKRPKMPQGVLLLQSHPSLRCDSVDLERCSREAAPVTRD